MILKKPYAFLIKHFRLIHVILTGLAAYAIYKTTPIVTFFRSYVANGYSTAISNDIISSFIPGILLGLLVVLIFLNIVILWLFIYKNKKSVFYLFYTLYYIVLLVVLFFTRGILTGLEQTPLAPDIARVYQDIAVIVYIPQLIYIVVCVVRALGFNIKQFNFSKDIQDLDITSEDNAEVELTFGLEGYKTKRGLRRFWREFVYYVKENTLMVILSLVVGIGVVIYLVFASSENYTDYYNTGDIFSFNNLQLSIDDVIVTNLDAGGSTLPKNKYYLLVKATAMNNSIKNEEFEYNNIRLYYSDTEYKEVVLNVSKYFVDYGQSIDNRLVLAQTKKTFVLPFEVDANILQNDLQIKMYTGITSKNNLYYATVGIVKLNPILINSITQMGTIRMNSTLNFSSTNLLNTTYTVNSYEVTDSYVYSYNYCYSKNNCRDYKDIVSRTSTSETILVLKGDLKLDSNAAFSQSKNATLKFMDYFGKIEYYINGIKYTASITNVTPQKFTGGFILKTNANIATAEKVNLLITIRNKQYAIVLKS